MDHGRLIFFWIEFNSNEFLIPLYLFAIINLGIYDYYTNNNYRKKNFKYQPGLQCII